MSSCVFVFCSIKAHLLVVHINFIIITVVLLVVVLANYCYWYVQVVEPDEIKKKAKLSYPHTSHCLANGQVMISAMGDVDGNAKGIDFVILYVVCKCDKVNPK